MKTVGLNPAAFLARDVLKAAKLKQEPTRNGFGEGLVRAGKADPRVMAVCCDLTESTRVLAFKAAFPDRFVQMGVSEQAMASIAAGMAMAGKVPFIASYAGFSPGRNWEQIRTCVALNDVNVKVAGAHAGVSVGPDGATHQMLEDIALMRVMPNMRVLVPCDSLETRKATVAVAKLDGPAYLRFAREKSPVFTTEKTPFKIGRAEVFRFGNDAAIIAAGPVLYEALLAAETLRKEGLEVRIIDCHSIKPFDVKTVVAAAKECGALVTVEEAQAAAGLGGVVAETLGSFAPVPLERMGMQDRFGESGEPTELMEAFGLTAPYIAMAVRRALKRKKGEKVAAVPEYVTAAEARLKEMKSEAKRA
ncbi:transketolase family protein [Patescibacteria group bacterium]|nr:MAG: transketolase family protein [Patescibacteria group bacterium]